LPTVRAYDGSMTNTQSIIDSIRTEGWTQAKAGIDALAERAGTDPQAAEWLAKYAPWTR
jgi:hypothetical protein